MIYQFIPVNNLSAAQDRCSGKHTESKALARLIVHRVNIIQKPHLISLAQSRLSCVVCLELPDSVYFGSGAFCKVDSSVGTRMLFATSFSLFFRKVISLPYSFSGFFLGRPLLVSFFSIVCLFSIL